MKIPTFSTKMVATCLTGVQSLHSAFLIFIHDDTLSQLYSFNSCFLFVETLFKVSYPMSMCSALWRFMSLFTERVCVCFDLVVWNGEIKCLRKEASEIFCKVKWKNVKLVDLEQLDFNRKSETVQILLMLDTIVNHTEDRWRRVTKVTVFRLSPRWTSVIW